MRNQLSWQIIKWFSGKNMLGFTYQDVVGAFPDRNPIYLARVLSEMTKKGMLIRIARDHYHIVPIDTDPKAYSPTAPQVARYFMRDREYYIGYATAMKIHGLTPGEEVREFVVTRKQIKPSVKDFGKHSFQFVQHDANRFFGFSSRFINQVEEAMVSDLEKTIVDAATKPQYCGGIVALALAMVQAKDRLDFEKVVQYLVWNSNKSAKKRFLYLAEILELEWTSNFDRLSRELGSGYSLLDPSQPKQGQQRKRFGLKMNVDPELIEKVAHMDGLNE